MKLAMLMPKLLLSLGEIGGIGGLLRLSSLLILRTNSVWFNWRNQIDLCGIFLTNLVACASSTWEKIREKGQPVNWWKLLWFDLFIPRHSFVGSLVMQKEIPTKERMLQWSLNVDSICVFFKAFTKNRDHLFFQCSFTKRIWESVIYKHVYGFRYWI